MRQEMLKSEENAVFLTASVSSAKNNSASCEGMDVLERNASPPRQEGSEDKLSAALKKLNKRHGSVLKRLAE